MKKIKFTKNKKAIFFTIDALVALIVILFAVLVIYPAIRPRMYESALSGDIIKVLSSLKIGEIRGNPVVDQLKLDGRITDYNKTILEQIGDFYVTDIATARILADSVLSTVDERENIGLWYGDELIASRNLTSMEAASNVEVDRQIISGIQQGSSLTGFSARAYLTSSLQEKYFYFGGYVGDGNISVNVNYTGTLKDINLEVAANTNFSFCVNNAPPSSLCCGAALLEPAESQFEPKEFPLGMYASCFNSGNNIIKFYSLSEKNLFFAGGFIKAKYDSSGLYEQANRHYFPGIEGLINIYEGFYVPGQLNEMKIFFHYNSSYKMFLNIGNVTVFNKKSSGEVTEILDNAFLSSMLNYPSLSEKTVPLRLGLENVSVEILTNADLISVAELSGSVNQNVEGKKMLDWIKEGNEVFVLTVLNSSSNRVGLVAYDNDAEDESRNHNLSNNILSLNNTIYSWSGGQPTCICCGINKAVEKFLADWDASRYHAMIIMSDGKANSKCASLGVVPDLNGDGTADNARDHAIQAACNAYNLYGIRVNVIGYGPTTTIDEVTLRNMSACGHGNYYYSSATELSEKYRQAARDVIDAAYAEQTMSISGSVFTKLYPDSYIEFDYTRAPIPYGLITTHEKKFSNKYSGNFSFSSEVSILDTSVVSYSGPRWTDSVKINNGLVYKLSNYGKNYTELGDPYSVHIPNSLVLGNNFVNIVNVTTGTSPTDSTSGSKDNKIIYTVIRDTTVYSPGVATEAEGCIWDLEFTNPSGVGTIPSNNRKIPGDYGGADECYYQYGNMQIANTDDALQIAAFNLFDLLDDNNDGVIDIGKFSPDDININVSQFTGIPFAWGTEVQVRKWD